MNIVTLYYVISAFIFASNTNSPIINYGTLIVAIPYEDGIIMAADSRRSLKTVIDGNIVNLGYYDEVEKLFQLKQFVLGVSGRNDFNGVLINKIINDYNSSKHQSNTPSESLASFHDYLLENYGDVYGRDSLDNKFICCGYSDNIGEIAYLEDGKITIEPWSLIVSEKVSNKIQGKVKEKASHVESQADLIELIEDLIDMYATETNQSFKIGGPVSILKISIGNKITWIQNDFSYKSYNYYRVIIDDYFSGKLKVHYNKPEYKLLIDSILEKLRKKFNEFN